MKREIVTDATGRPVRNPQTDRVRSRVTDWEGDHKAGMALFFPGPLISGMLQLPTGAEYDVTEPEILVKREHVKALQRAIHAEHHRQGRFLAYPIPED